TSNERAPAAWRPTRPHVSANVDATRAVKVSAIADAIRVAARLAQIPSTFRLAPPKSIHSRSRNSASGREIETATAIETAIARANESAPTSPSKAVAIALTRPSDASAKD